MNSTGDELKTLGQIIRRRRRVLNISQDELAYRTGLHRTYLSDVERGHRNISFFSLVAIARGLGVTISELTVGVGSSKPGAPNGTVGPAVSTAGFTA